jgi:hypothetical protein
MGAGHAQLGSFEKVGECLYRYSSNGMYYALVRQGGKLIRRSLGTTDKAYAKRKLADLKRDLNRMDPTSGRVTLAALCERYLGTCTNQAPKTIRRKHRYFTRLATTALYIRGKLLPPPIPKLAFAANGNKKTDGWLFMGWLLLPQRFCLCNTPSQEHPDHPKLRQPRSA